MAIETLVFNQSVPFEDVDLLAGDPALREALEREGAGWAVERVREAGWSPPRRRRRRTAAARSATSRG